MGKTQKTEKRESNFHAIMRRLFKNKLAVAGLVILAVVIILAIIAPWIAPYKYSKLNPVEKLQGPSLKHLFGTDDLGRDVLSRILVGAKYSLGLGLAAVAVSTLGGLFFGSIAGYAGGRIDNIIMRCMDILSSLPSILLAITIAASLGAGFFNTVLAMSIGGIPNVTRMVRSSVLNIVGMDYVEASRSIGCGHIRMIIFHVIPNGLSPLIVMTSMGIGNHILIAAMLSFIGLGIQPPTPEWGAMLASSRNYILDYPYLCLFPGLTIAIVVLAFNLFGDGLRDAMDPKLKN